MSSDYSREGLLTFLKEAALAGRIKPATARSRRNAAAQLFEHLTEEEAADLRRLDVEELTARCHKLQGGTARPEVLELYGDRLRSALAEYFQFLKAPDSFVSVGEERRPRRRPAAGNERSAEEKALEELRLGETRYRPEVIPVPIRDDKVVYLHGLPADLTTAEARKIARVVEALATEQEAEG